jgi:hypothetical protein
MDTSGQAATAGINAVVTNCLYLQHQISSCVQHNAFSNKTMQLSLPGRNCMTHCQVLQDSPDKSQALLHKKR